MNSSIPCTFPPAPAITTQAGVFSVLTTIFIVLTKLRHSHPHLLVALYRLYQELASVGIVAFLVVVVVNSCLSSDIAARSGTVTEVISQLAHFLQLVVSLFYMFYALVVVVQMIFAVLRVQRWRGLDAVSLSAARTNVEQLEYRGKQMHILQRVFHLLHHWRLWRARAILQHQVLRIRYIQRHSLSERFQFDAFISRSLEGVCGDVVGIPWTIWAVIACFILINVIRAYTGIAGDTTELPYAHYSLPVFGFAVMLVAYTVTGVLYWQLREQVHEKHLRISVRSPSPGVPLTVSPSLQASPQPPSPRSTVSAMSGMSSWGNRPFCSDHSSVPLRHRILLRTYQLCMMCLPFYFTCLVVVAIYFPLGWSDWLRAVCALPAVLVIAVPTYHVPKLYTLLTILERPPRNFARTEDVPLAARASSWHWQTPPIEPANVLSVRNSSFYSAPEMVTVTPASPPVRKRTDSFNSGLALPVPTSTRPRAGSDRSTSSDLGQPLLP